MFSDEMFSSDSNTRGLSAVFQRSEATKQGSDSFSYKAPVQPKKQAQSPAKAAAAPAAVRPTVLNFWPVSAYKQLVANSLLTFHLLFFCFSFFFFTFFSFHVCM